MEQKTQVTAHENQQEIFVTRTFNLPVESLFTAFVDPEIVAQWMGTKVLKLTPQTGGCFQFETTGPKGDKHLMSGVIHQLEPHKKIIRTFEMEQMPFGVQLELISFKRLSADKSQLDKQIIYQSVQHRDENLKLPFKQGINWAHNQLQKVAENLKISRDENA